MEGHTIETSMTNGTTNGAAHTTKRAVARKSLHPTNDGPIAEYERAKERLIARLQSIEVERASIREALCVDSTDSFGLPNGTTSAPIEQLVDSPIPFSVSPLSPERTAPKREPTHHKSASTKTPPKKTAPSERTARGSGIPRKDSVGWKVLWALVASPIRSGTAIAEELGEKPQAIQGRLMDLRNAKLVGRQGDRGDFKYFATDKGIELIKSGGGEATQVAPAPKRQRKVRTVVEVAADDAPEHETEDQSAESERA